MKQISISQYRVKNKIIIELDRPLEEMVSSYIENGWFDEMLVGNHFAEYYKKYDVEDESPKATELYEKCVKKAENVYKREIAEFLKEFLKNELS